LGAWAAPFGPFPQLIRPREPRDISWFNYTSITGDSLKETYITNYFMEGFHAYLGAYAALCFELPSTECKPIDSDAMRAFRYFAAILRWLGIYDVCAMGGVRVLPVLCGGGRGGGGEGGGGHGNCLKRGPRILTNNAHNNTSVPCRAY
jgi:hypothetical protein